MNERGWVFSDVLVSLVLLTIATAVVFPALRNIWSLENRQVEIVHNATEASDEDPWKAFR
jgi:hypothetical protein